MNMQVSDAFKDIQLIGFDFDGTLAQYGDGLPWPSSWQLISRELGCFGKIRPIDRDFFAGKFDVATWSQKTAEVYMEYNLTRGRLHDILVNGMSVAPNADRLFERLRKKGIKIAIVSGSLEEAYEIFVERFGLKADYPRFAHRFIFDDRGILTGGRFTNYDFELKTKVLEDICSKAGVDLKNCAYVGDEANDLHIFREVGLPIAINAAKQEVRDAAKLVIDGPDFSPMLSYL